MEISIVEIRQALTAIAIQVESYKLAVSGYQTVTGLKDSGTQGLLELRSLLSSAEANLDQARKLAFDLQK